MSDSEDTPTTKSSRPIVVVEYCKICSLPTEYCEYGPSADKCLKVNGPHKNNNKSSSSSSATAETSESNNTTTTTTTTTADSNTEKLKDLKIVDDSKEESHVSKGEDNGEAEEKPKKKSSKEARPTIVIEVNQRNKRKHITSIVGLELFGIKLSDAQKMMAKKFSCGCSVVKDSIVIQGDFQEELVDFIEEKYSNIPLSDIYFLEEGKKVRAR